MLQAAVLLISGVHNFRLQFDFISKTWAGKLFVMVINIDINAACGDILIGLLEPSSSMKSSKIKLPLIHFIWYGSKKTSGFYNARIYIGKSPNGKTEFLFQNFHLSIITILGLYKMWKLQIQKLKRRNERGKR